MATILLGAGLVGCASVGSRAAGTMEAIEGNPTSYPAFEAAARECGFTALRKVGNGQGGSHYLVSFSSPFAPADTCLIRWLEQRPELGLYRSGH
ncbi:MAG: hypothetical protein REJ23_02300 [Brevundimonas sp.]|nr:hypothetical protein [Brevundimonas sp.]